MRLFPAEANAALSQLQRELSAERSSHEAAKMEILTLVDEAAALREELDRVRGSEERLRAELIATTGDLQVRCDKLRLIRFLKHLFEACVTGPCWQQWVEWRRHGCVV